MIVDEEDDAEEMSYDGTIDHKILRQVQIPDDEEDEEDYQQIDLVEDDE
jgi:hypothetical protein